MFGYGQQLASDSMHADELELFALPWHLYYLDRITHD